MTVHKVRSGGAAARILISAVGAALILWSAGAMALGIGGTRTTAVITDIRRQGGERNEAVPNRYAYSTGYTFTLPDGRAVDGSATRIGGAVYLKADGTSMLPVRYWKLLPAVSAPEEDTAPSVGKLVQAAAGVFLIRVMWGEKRGAGHKRR